MKTATYSGKVAAVTGAASGMGRSLVVELARRGCEVACSDVDEAGLAETVRLAAGGARVVSRRLDVTSEADLRSWADEVVRDFGRVNLVFNNAGVSYGSTFAEGDVGDWRRCFDVDFFGVVNGTRAFLPHLEASGDGHVVNVSSVFGIIGFPGQTAYNAAKFAVRGFTESLRIELEVMGSAVTATCIHPGGVKTNIARTTKVHASLAKLGIKPELAGSEMEKQFKLTADQAAEIILRGVARNQRRVLVGSDARALDVLARWLPGSYGALIVRFAKRRARQLAASR